MLAARMAAVAARWGLTLGPPFPVVPGRSGNLVAPARRADGLACVLKVSPHVAAIRAEYAALEVWAGQGAARVLTSDLELGALLLERVVPGTPLIDVAATDDDAAARITAGVLRVLWRAPIASAGAGLQPLDEWTAVFDRQRAAPGARVPGVDAVPAALFARADAARTELLASTAAVVPLHGDLHPGNVLRDARRGWLAIDPKGLVGDPCFDICQYLMNPRAVPLAVTRRRFDLFCAELDLDRPRARAWCLVHAVLNVCWAVEDGTPLDSWLAYAWQAAVL
jgi:streptomycin 6-kinase